MNLETQKGKESDAMKKNKKMIAHGEKKRRQLRGSFHQRESKDGRLRKGVSLNAAEAQVKRGKRDRKVSTETNDVKALFEGPVKHPQKRRSWPTRGAVLSRGQLEE